MTLQDKEPVITIDGASGTGKGTISQHLAKRLGWKFLDSGALYRVLALAAKRHGFSLEDEKYLDDEDVEGLRVLAAHLDVQFFAQESTASLIVLEGEDVTDMIRTEELGKGASIVGTLQAVRMALLARQRDFREAPGLVADGRDMGTVVFPDAEIKFFLTASIEERALRRYNQLKDKGDNANLGDLIEKLRERDKRDQERLVAPLKPADDAICINTDRLSIEQVFERIMVEIDQKKAFPVVNSLMSHPVKRRAAE